MQMPSAPDKDDLLMEVETQPPLTTSLGTMRSALQGFSNSGLVAQHVQIKE